MPKFHRLFSQLFRDKRCWYTQRTGFERASRNNKPIYSKRIWSLHKRDSVRTNREGALFAYLRSWICRTSSSSNTATSARCLCDDRCPKSRSFSRTNRVSDEDGILCTLRFIFCCMSHGWKTAFKNSWSVWKRPLSFISFVNLNECWTKIWGYCMAIQHRIRSCMPLCKHFK